MLFLGCVVKKSQRKTIRVVPVIGGDHISAGNYL